MSICPICSKPASAEHTPFCSKRCQLVDLGKWLSGSYAVPVVEMDDVDDVLPEEDEQH